MGYTLTVSETFAAAHFLPNYDGACGNMHGHTWQVEATWAYADLQPDGMAEDFGALKQRLRAIMPDHRCLNEVYPWTPTAENLARHFAEELGADSVTVWESETACVRYAASD